MATRVASTWIGRGSLPPDPQSLPIGFVSVSLASHAITLLHEHGGACPDVEDELGIDPRLFRHPQNRISLRALGRVFALCAERSPHPHFGLLTGVRAGLSAFGALEPHLKAAKTVGGMFRLLEAQIGAQPGAIFALEEHSDVAVLSFLPYDPTVEGIGVVSEAVLAAIAVAVRETAGSDWRPAEVRLAKRAPTNVLPYQGFFRAPVRFDQEVAALIVPAAGLRCALAALRVPMPPPLPGQIEVTGSDSAVLVERIRQHLRREMLRRPFCATEVARSFALHRRTLTRRLQAEGTTLRALVDEVRFAVARQLVTDTDIPLVQVSAALHFSEPAAFTRAFERWSGTAPSSLRTKKPTSKGS